jgi:hypothetical protein
MPFPRVKASAVHLVDAASARPQWADIRGHRYRMKPGPSSLPAKAPRLKARGPLLSLRHLERPSFFKTSGRSGTVGTGFPLRQARGVCAEIMRKQQAKLDCVST